MWKNAYQCFPLHIFKKRINVFFWVQNNLRNVRVGIMMPQSDDKCFSHLKYITGQSEAEKRFSVYPHTNKPTHPQSHEWRKHKKQAGAELGQAKLKLGLDFNLYIWFGRIGWVYFRLDWKDLVWYISVQCIF